MSNAYKDSGVDIDAGNLAVEKIKNHVHKTYREEVITDLGGFGGLFSLNKKYNNPVLVSGTDGVGTKLKIAYAMDKHDTIGQDLVAMCVNDILVYGAEPLFFLDYIATSKLKPNQIEEIVKGISDGCLSAKCSLIGGETAEMPGIYHSDEYDLAGFAVGIVEKEEIINGGEISKDDIIIGLASNGLHSNGYSLVRHILFEQNSYSLSDYVDELGNTLGEELLKPTKIYVNSILELKKKIKIKGMAHITGGGLVENIPRVLPDNSQANIDQKTWNKSKIFDLLQEKGNLSDYEMNRTFNMGIGFIVIIDKEDKDVALRLLNELGEEADVIGKISEGEKKVTFTNN